MVKIWLDDVRPAPPGWTWTKSIRDTTALLRTGQVTELSLDFDLDGSDPGHKGDEVLDWLKHALRRREIPAPVIHLHSANPYGAALMTWKLKRLESAHGHQPISVGRLLVRELRHNPPPVSLPPAFGGFYPYNFPFWPTTNYLFGSGPAYYGHWGAYGQARIAQDPRRAAFPLPNPPFW